MKKLHLIITVVLSVILVSGLFSCKNRKQASTLSENPDSTVSTIMEIDDLLANIDKLVDRTVTITGICTHTCKHGATKMFLMGSDDTKTIRVDAGKLKAFDTRCINSMVKVKGKVIETRIDEAYLQQLEKQTKEESSGHAEKEICEHESKATNNTGTSTIEVIKSYREKIAEQQAENGKPYISQYFIVAESYEF